MIDSVFCFFFCKQKTAYDMRISDWSSDVCSSDLVQQAIVAAKQDNPRRSIRQIRELLEAAGSVAAGSLSRSAIHRLLQQQGLSRIDGSASQLEEKRSFVAEFAGSIWYGDVMHGPAIPVAGRHRKV